LKKIWIITLISLCTILIAIRFYLDKNPPLKSSGLTQSNASNEIILEMNNVGIANIQLSKVLINGKELPHKLELGVSRTSHMVLGGGLDEDPNISFHPITELPIEKELTPESKRELIGSGDKSAIFHYGLRLNHNEPIKNITIHYQYVGLNLSIERDIMK
jgi:hypothetical protein